MISKSNADYVPNLASLAQDDYDLVIGVGFLMADAVEKVANRFPEVDFAIIDYSQAAMKTTPDNVRGLLFKEQEAGYLVGYLAGLMSAQESGSKQVISAVGGQKIPPVDHYIAGYGSGRRKANPGITILNAYSQDFVDQAKCKEVALNQIAQGSDIVFQVAGQCGLGALSAAKEKNVWGIGVDADQLSYLGTHILTSALKKVDNAVFQSTTWSYTASIRLMQNSPLSSIPYRAEQSLDLPAGSGGAGSGNAAGPSHQSLVQRARGRDLAQPAGWVREREQDLEPIGRHPRLVLEGRIGRDVGVALQKSHEDRRAAAACAGEHHGLAARVEAGPQRRAAPADRRHRRPLPMGGSASTRSSKRGGRESDPMVA